MTVESGSEEDRSIDRRNVLKGVAAGATTTFAVSGTAAAGTEGISRADIKQVTAPYRELNTVRQAFDDQRSLLEDVAESGYITEASVDALGLTELREPAPEHDGEGVTYGAKEVDGKLTPEVRYFRNLDEGILTVAVFPDLDDGYAVLNPHDSDEPIEIQSVDAAACDSCGSNKCCNECGYECCNCCGCEPCDQCFSCTCGMCYTCVDCQCCQCGWNCLGQCS